MDSLIISKRFLENKYSLLINLWLLQSFVSGFRLEFVSTFLFDRTRSNLIGFHGFHLFKVKLLLVEITCFCTNSRSVESKVILAEGPWICQSQLRRESIFTANVVLVTFDEYEMPFSIRLNVLSLLLSNVLKFSLPCLQSKAVSWNYSKTFKLDDSGTLLSTFPFITNLSLITPKILKKVVTDLESSNVCDSEEVWARTSFSLANLCKMYLKKW